MQGSQSIFYVKSVKYKRVGKAFSLLAARHVRHFSGIVPLHGPVHKKVTKQILKSALLRRRWEEGK